MRKILAISLLALALPLGGCSDQLLKMKTTFTNVVSAIGSVKVKSKDAYIAINVFNAAEKSVTSYLNLPQCGKMPCRIIGSASALSPSFNAGIGARNDLRAWMDANPGTIADAGLYNTLKAATTALQKVMTTYNIGAK
jgi:hypothetical protein